MPSSFRLRTALGIRPRQNAGSQQIVDQPQLPALVLTTITPSVGTSSITNVAFEEAVAEHLKKLDPEERKSFQKAYDTLSPQDILSKVKDFDNAHNDTAVSRKCAEPITRFLRAVEQVMQGVAIGIQSNPEISSLVVGAVRLVIDLAVKFVTFFSRLTEMMARLSDHLEHLAEYSEACHEVDLLRTAGYPGQFANVYGALLDFCKRTRLVFVNKDGTVRSWTSIRIFIRVQWEPFDASFGTIESNFHHHLNVLLHSSQALQLNAIQSGNQAADEERHRVRQKEIDDTRRDALRWLSKINFDEDHNTILAKRHPGTGTWLLKKKEYQDWFHRQTSSLLWCFGHPGAGKSVLASLVLDKVCTQHQLDETVGIAFVYFRFDSPDLQQPSNIISALIKQLCQRKRKLTEDTLNLYHEYSRNDQLPSLEKYQDHFTSLVGSFRQMFLIIDGLDECDIRQRPQVIDFITELTASLNHVRIFVTSRRESDIEYAFLRQKTPIIEIEAKKVAEDISTFVHDQVETLVSEGKLRLGAPIGHELKSKIISTLVARADGMFLWVNLQLDNLCRQRSDRDVERELNALPFDLNDTYLRIIRQIDQKPKALQLLAKKALTWVFHAVMPLGMSELIDALAIKEDARTRNDLDFYSKETILEACGNLLKEEGRDVRPIHYSVQEFFTQPPESALNKSISKYFPDQDTSQAQIALDCMSYLRLNFLASPCEDFSRLRFRIFENPLSWYSSKFFDKHICALREVSKSVLQSLDLLISLDGDNLAAILQIRRLRDRYKAWEDFSKYRGSEVNAVTLIYSTALFNLAYFHEKNGKWGNLCIPKYTLHQTCAGGSLDAVIRLIQSGQELNDRDKDGVGVTPLYYGAEFGHINIVRRLLQNGADINVQCGRYGNALQVALSREHEAIAELLLEKGADVNAQGGFYGNALQAASDGGHEAIVKLFLEKEADVNTQGGFYGNALQAASYRGNEAIVKLLLEKGADVNTQGGHYSNALQAASDGGHEAIVKLLLEKEADVNAQGGHYGNALQAASYRGNEAIVKLPKA